MAVRRIASYLVLAAGVYVVNDWRENGGVTRLCVRLGYCGAPSSPKRRPPRPVTTDRGQVYPVPRLPRIPDIPRLPLAIGDTAIATSQEANGTLALGLPADPVGDGTTAGDLETSPRPSVGGDGGASTEAERAPAPIPARLPVEQGTTVTVRLDTRVCTDALGAGKLLRGTVHAASRAGEEVSGLDGASVALRVVSAASTRNPTAKPTITLALEELDVRGERLHPSAPRVSPTLELDGESRAQRGAAVGTLTGLLGAAADYANRRDVKAAARTGVAAGAAGAAAGAATARRTGCLPQGAPFTFDLNRSLSLPPLP
jgi:hypothetical protein